MEAEEHGEGQTRRSSFGAPEVGSVKGGTWWWRAWRGDEPGMPHRLLAKAFGGQRDHWAGARRRLTEFGLGSGSLGCL